MKFPSDRSANTWDSDNCISTVIHFPISDTYVLNLFKKSCTLSKSYHLPWSFITKSFQQISEAENSDNVRITLFPPKDYTSTISWMNLLLWCQCSYGFFCFLASIIKWSQFQTSQKKIYYVIANYMILMRCTKTKWSKSLHCAVKTAPLPYKIWQLSNFDVPRKMH